MRFLLGRTEVCVSYAVLPFYFWCIAIGEGSMLLIGLTTLAVHECAHLISAKNLGFEPVQISVYPIGAVMRFRKDTVDPGKEWIVAAAGPLGSAALASVLYLIRTVFMVESETMRQFQIVGFSIAALNAIPAFPLDGGRIMKSILCSLLKEQTAKRVSFVMTVFCAVAFASVGTFLLTKGLLSAWTLLSVSLFLIPSAIREWKMPEPGIIGDVLNRSRLLRRGERRKAVFVVLSSDATIGDAISAVSVSCVTFFRIYHGNGYYELSENDLLREAGRFGYGEPLKTLISSLTGKKSCVIIH